MKKKHKIKFKRFNYVKSICLIICFIIVNISYTNAYSLTYTEQTQFTLNLNNTTVKEVFNYIEKNSEFIFIYHGSNIDLNRKVNVDVKNKNVTEILNQIFKDTDTQYIINDRQIIIKKDHDKSLTLTASIKSDQQDKQSITGTVKDKTGEPLIGVTVTVKGNSSIGTITDINGRYTLPVPAGSTLVFSYVGYTSKEERIGSQSLINVILSEDDQLLNEVVVVGYGTQTKANLTGAVAQVSGDVLENRPIANISQGLQGVIPNLNVNLASGAPGQSTSFNVRGNTSINDGAPLVLVDNVQMDPDLVNPNDIASISVLKDAASAAIYGARAAYGVILITTKNGKKEQKPQITLSGNGYWQSPAQKVETVNSMEYLTIMDIAYQNGGGSGHYFNPKIYEYAEKYFNDPKNNKPVFYDASIDPNKYQYVGNTNWWDEIYKESSFSQQYNLGVSGGSSNTSYYMSFGYNDVGGLLKEGNDKYQRFNTNINISTDLTKWLTVSGKAMYNYTVEQHPAGGVSQANSTAYAGIKPYGGYLKNDLSPLMPVRHPDGNFAGQGNYTNPVAIQAQGGNAYFKRNDLWLTGILRITPFEGMIINADYTFNSYNRGDKTHVRKFIDYTAVAGTENYYPWTNPNSVVMANNEDYYNAFNLFGEYTKSFNKTHNFKVMTGYNQEYKHVKSFYAGRKNLIDNDNPSLNLANGERFLSGSETHWGIEGFFMRLNYNYMQKYLFEFNGRYDGSSKFPSGDRYAFFPSASAAWRISSESFWDPLKTWWDDLKIRVSYGSLGNQNLNSGGVSRNFPYLPSYSVGDVSYLINGAIPIGVGPSGLVSPSFTWEKVYQINIGFDATLFQNRLQTSFDWYRRETKDMFASSQPLPGVLGTNVPLENGADMKTTGFELSVAWMDRLSSGFSYWVRATLADYQAEITRYNNPTGSVTSNNSYYKGKKLGEVWGYRSDGLFQSDEEVKNSPSQLDVWNGNWGAGDVKFKDLNGDGKISYGNYTLDDMGDRTIIGNTTPRYSFGLTVGAEYKNFDFEMFWRGILKRDASLGGSSYWGLTSEWDVPLKQALDYWTPQNTGAFFPRPMWKNSGNREMSDRYIQNGAYGRLKNITVGYTLPKPLLSKIGISKCRIYLVGENLITITSLIKSFDPETLDNMTYPITKKYSIGFNLTF